LGLGTELKKVGQYTRSRGDATTEMNPDNVPDPLNDFK
jgi:hypothetical protein